MRLCFGWHVVKREGSQNDIKTAWCELVHNAVPNKAVISRSVERARLIQHCLRNVCAGDIQSEISKESSRSTGSAAEVESSTAVVVAPNQCRQIAKREVVRSRKLKRRICARAFL